MDFNEIISQLKITGSDHPAQLGDGYDPEYLKKVYALYSNPALEAELTYSMKQLIANYNNAETWEDFRAIQLTLRAILEIYQRIGSLAKELMEEQNEKSNLENSEDSDNEPLT